MSAAVLKVHCVIVKTHTTGENMCKCHCAVGPNCIFANWREQTHSLMKQWMSKVHPFLSRTVKQQYIVRGSVAMSQNNIFY